MTVDPYAANPEGQPPGVTHVTPPVVIGPEVLRDKVRKSIAAAGHYSSVHAPGYQEVEGNAYDFADAAIEEVLEYLESANFATVITAEVYAAHVRHAARNR